MGPLGAEEIPESHAGIAGASEELAVAWQASDGTDWSDAAYGVRADAE